METITILNYNKIISDPIKKDHKDLGEVFDNSADHYKLNIAVSRLLEFKEKFVGLDLTKQSFIPTLFSKNEAKGLIAIPYVAKSNLEFPEEQIEPELGLKLDFRFGQVLGIILGDGWWDKKNYGRHKYRCLYISDLKGDNANYVINYLKEAFDCDDLHVSSRTFYKKDIPDHWGDTVKYTILSPKLLEFTQWLTFNFGGEGSDDSTGSKNKYMKDWVFRSPLEFQLGILNGLISTDGSIGINRVLEKPRLIITYSSTSIDLIKGLEKILINLGIQFKSIIGKTTRRLNTSYGMSISTVDSKLYKAFDNIADLGKRTNWLTTEVDTEKSRKYDNICIPDFVVKELEQFLFKGKLKSLKGYTEEQLKKFTKIAHKSSVIFQARKKGVCSRFTANMFLDLEDEINQFRQELFNYFITVLETFLSMPSINIDLLLLYFTNFLNTCLPLSNNLPENLHELRKTFMKRLTTFKSRCVNNKQDPLRNKTLKAILLELKQLGPYQTNFVKTSTVIKEWKEKIIDNFNLNWDTINA